MSGPSVLCSVTDVLEAAGKRVYTGLVRTEVQTSYDHNHATALFLHTANISDAACISSNSLNLNCNMDLLGTFTSLLHINAREQTIDNSRTDNCLYVDICPYVDNFPYLSSHVSRCD